ncbi:hypothetical protein AMECASPLE_019027 [Ameca splendens]|uniref:Uncharacterized protein n=1 Tax=Ameca splendens TaxID=208324 RepID=A0ABV1A9A7_9TELE
MIACQSSGLSVLDSSQEEAQVTAAPLTARKNTEPALCLGTNTGSDLAAKSDFLKLILDTKKAATGHRTTAGGNRDLQQRTPAQREVGNLMEGMKTYPTCFLILKSFRRISKGPGNINITAARMLGFCWVSLDRKTFYPI